MTRFALRTLFLLAAAGCVAALWAAAAGAGTTAAPAASIPMTGTTSSGGTFTGTMDITGFAVQNGQLVALGTVSGTVTDAAGNPAGTVTDAAVAAPVQAPQQQGTSCTLFSFSVGPDINVAGLMLVHIDPIGASVSVEGILGSLLCGILGGGGTTP